MRSLAQLLLYHTSSIQTLFVALINSNRSRMSFLPVTCTLQFCALFDFKSDPTSPSSQSISFLFCVGHILID